METRIEEIWKDVVGYEGYYQVSNFGRIKRLEGLCFHYRGIGTRRVYERILKQGFCKRFGYLSVSLSVNGIAISKRVNILVAVAFILNPLNKPQVNHMDHVKTNNRVDNLEWVTASENKIHTIKAGRVKNIHCDGIVDAEKALKIREMWSGGITQMQIARLFAIGQSEISRVINRKRKYRVV